MSGESLIIGFLTAAWLLPLVGFVIEIYALKWTHRLSKAPAYVAIGCIAAGFVCSSAALITWGVNTGWVALQRSPSHVDGHGDHHAAGQRGRGEARTPTAALLQVPSDAPVSAEAASNPNAGTSTQDHAEDHGHPAAAKSVGVISGSMYRLATFGPLSIGLDYYIDSLTLVMFTMVTFIATCIHIFATGYMHEELTEEYVDHECHTRDGHHLHRPGRFHRFFAYLSLFCFSMLGLVLAGNIFQVFVFWELVGVCSYLLIGFYFERHSASTAANKAFIMNRVGDFGFLIGLMILWTNCGTFSFFDTATEPGLFTMLRGADQQFLLSPSGQEVLLRGLDGQPLSNPDGSSRSLSYLLLVAAGCGVFAGSIGKSAQFPLQTWLPDAMEGPTPVSALVHSATMVAAGVYLAGRFYPVFTPEVLLVIAYIGCITAFVAATIAIVATDIKKVLAYSTISQLGYMMLGIGLSGWGAGLFHLVTHAFFKSLMFLSSGSVIAGCHHVQDMRQMGGLRSKMPITATAMLVGVIAIAGLAVPPFLLTFFGEPIAFSGFHSKDAIVATALAYSQANGAHSLLFFVPLLTAGITSFYMFRLWFLTFAGTPRDEHVYDHCQETPWAMTGPLVVLSVLAAFCALGGEQGPLYRLLAFSHPAPLEHALVHEGPVSLTLPGEHEVHAVHSTAGLLALIAAFTGFAAAYAIYVQRAINPDDVRRSVSWVYEFLVDKWRFDTLYDVMFVRPVHVVARWCTAFDRGVLDGILHGSARATVAVAHVDRKFDESMIDGFINLLGQSMLSFGRSLHVFQTGRLRQYVMFIAVSVVVLFAALFVSLPR